MECRTRCGACCIAISISTPIPGQPEGKAAGVPCAQLKKDLSCGIYSSRPKVCREFIPTEEFCGQNRDEALSFLHDLEIKTAPPIQTGFSDR